MLHMGLHGKLHWAFLLAKPQITRVQIFLIHVTTTTTTTTMIYEYNAVVHGVYISYQLVWFLW
jgi:hypothetical protein